MENDISTNNSVKGIKSHHSCDFSVDRNEIIRLIFAWSEKDEGIFTYTITISSEASYIIRTLLPVRKLHIKCFWIGSLRNYYSYDPYIVFM